MTPPAGALTATKPASAAGSAAPALSALQEWRRGWPAALGATLGQGAGLYMFNTVAGFFVKPLSHEFGWGRGVIATTSTALFVCSLLLPATGAIADRRGVRALIAIGSLAVAACYLALASMTGEVWRYFAALALIAFIGGPCTSPSILMRPVVIAFDHSRGLALSAAMCGVPLLAFAVLPVLQHIIATQGWRAGYAHLGAMTLLLGGLSVFLLGHRPKAAGARPGHSAEADRTGAESGMAVREALGDMRLWLLGLAMVALNFGVGIYLSSLQPMLSDRGVDGRTAALLMVWYGAAVVIGRLASGVLLDRFWPPLIGCVALAGPLFGLLLLAVAGPSLGLLATAIALIALATGAETDILSFITARYFGLRSFGALSGMLGGVTTVSIAIGGMVAGNVFDVFRTYGPVLLVGSALSGVAALAVLGSGFVRPRLSESPSARDRRAGAAVAGGKGRP
jgi:predicted MFS family arabinose efflux permease